MDALSRARVRTNFWSVVVLRARKAIGHSEGGLFTRARLYYFVDALWYYARELIVDW